MAERVRMADRLTDAQVEAREQWRKNRYGLTAPEVHAYEAGLLALSQEDEGPDARVRRLENRVEVLEQADLNREEHGFVKGWNAALAASPVASREDEGLRIEVVPASEIDAGESVIFDRFGEVERVVEIELRTPTDDMRRLRTDHPVRRRRGMPLMDDTPVIRVLAAASPVASREIEAADG